MEQEKSKGYVFAVCQNADDPYICGALHVERDDQAVPWIYETDEEAARAVERDGVKLANYNDCGLILFDREEQDVHAGASGCGCSASVLCGYLLPGLLSGRWSRILFCPTGALHSPTATMQGESIPGICHALALEGGK